MEWVPWTDPAFLSFVSFDSSPGWRESLASSHDGILVLGLDGRLLNYYNYYFELVIRLLGSKIKTIQKVYGAKSHSFPCPHSPTSLPHTYWFPHRPSLPLLFLVHPSKVFYTNKKKQPVFLGYPVFVIRVSFGLTNGSASGSCHDSLPRSCLILVPSCIVCGCATLT